MNKYLLPLLLLISSGTFSQYQYIDWQAFYGGTSNEIAERILPIDDDTYYLFGWTVSSDGPIAGYHLSPDNKHWPDVLVVKYSKKTGVIWQRCLGSVYTEFAVDAQITADGGLILLCDVAKAGGDISSVHPSPDGESDVWMVKLDVNGQLEWERSYGGTGEDDPQQVIQTPDGGYLFLATEHSADGDVSDQNLTIGSQAWLVRTDATGNMIWERSVAGIAATTGGHMLLQGNGAIMVAMSGCQMIGVTGSTDIHLLKLNGSGTVLWQQTYSGNKDDFPLDLIRLADGGYMICGYSYSNGGDVTGHHGNATTNDAIVLKTDANGHLEWSKSYGGSGREFAKRIIPSGNGGYYLCGNTTSIDGDLILEGDALIGNTAALDGWIIKIDPVGEIVWQKVMKDVGALGNDICQLPNGKLLHFSQYARMSELAPDYNVDWRVTEFSNAIQATGEEALNLSIYPVPFTDELTISTGVAAYYRIRLYDATGKRLLSESFEAQDEMTLNALSFLPPGPYIVEVKDDDRIVRQSVVKM